MFHTFGCLRESSSICSQLGRLLRLRAPILNLRLQYTQDLSLRATCLTTGSGMSYLVAFLKTRDGIPYLFVISSPSVSNRYLSGYGTRSCYRSLFRLPEFECRFRRPA